MAAFACEIPHCSDAVRNAFASAQERLVDIVASAAAATKASPPSSIVAALVGGLLMGRAMEGVDGRPARRRRR